MAGLRRAGLIAVQVVLLAAATWCLLSSTDGWPRDVAAAYLLLVAPGAALVVPLRLRQRDVTLLLVVATSVAVDMICTQLVVHQTGLQVQRVTQMVVGVAAAGLLLQLLQAGLLGVRRGRREARHAAA